MNPTYDFTGQVALVTDASSGMGLVIARAFADSGAPVVLADINGPCWPSRAPSSRRRESPFHAMKDTTSDRRGPCISDRSRQR